MTLPKTAHLQAACALRRALLNEKINYPTEIRKVRNAVIETLDTIDERGCSQTKNYIALSKNF